VIRPDHATDDSDAAGLHARRAHLVHTEARTPPTQVASARRLHDDLRDPPAQDARQRWMHHDKGKPRVQDAR
jgi:hypothetical protein